MSGEDDDPHIVVLLVEFLYTGDYTFTCTSLNYFSSTSNSTSTSSPAKNQCILHLNLHILADLWDIPPLRNLTLTNLGPAIEKLELRDLDCVLRFLYDYEDGAGLRRLVMMMLVRKWEVRGLMRDAGVSGFLGGVCGRGGGFVGMWGGG